MRRVSIGFCAVALLALAGCSDRLALPVSPADAPRHSVGALPALGQTYVILGRGGALPNGLAADVARAGGSMISILNEVGVAFAQSSSPDFRSRVARLRGVESVTPDLMVTRTPPVSIRREIPDEIPASAAGLETAVASIGDDETFFSFQWAPAAVQAPEAWTAGFTGKGVRVAILDGAIHSAHLDLAPNLDVAASRSFVAGFDFNQDIGSFWHGTHVAGIVAAADNGFGTIGIAPGATLIGIKVIHGQTGSFLSLLQGLLYAATSLAEGGAGAHVVNMSLALTIDEKNRAIKADVRELARVTDRVTTYAHRRGVTLVAAAGNDTTDYDLENTLLLLPAMSQHVISVGATGPHGWALGATDFARPTYYTNFGKALVDLSAPGGTVGLFAVDGVDEICAVQGTFATVVTFCEVFDTILSTVRGGPTSTSSYNWAQGTSMAAPVVAGIAALVIERNGGSMHPAQVAAALQQGAIDHGEPGNDPFHGKGWVNAFRSVQAMRADAVASLERIDGSQSFQGAMQRR